MVAPGRGEETSNRCPTSSGLCLAPPSFPSFYNLFHEQGSGGTLQTPFSDQLHRPAPLFGPNPPFTTPFSLFLPFECPLLSRRANSICCNFYIPLKARGRWRHLGYVSGGLGRTDPPLQPPRKRIHYIYFSRAISLASLYIIRINLKMKYLQNPSTKFVFRCLIIGIRTTQTRTGHSKCFSNC